ncbi:organic cation transporter-like protein [Drosophila persimilis]|uniref:Organic cation transporter-like protein isoform X2 n=1 Tax=Drosophila pseudoobscura pseudoobscura TaxID=46245 RepID=A0A6I8W1U9_DROPS|nr:organic cation transporter-like protein [Drosophila persimilis]XP_033237326.1 organic cation transporter-like protein isoform X2 [Drosophila pseudoobscura]
MDFIAILDKCGNYGKFQVVILLLYGYTNILGSLHYFSQTLITFTPEHWCAHEDLTGFGVEELRTVYSNVSQPSCTLLEDVINGTGIASEHGVCTDWIFIRESGFESITTELNWVCDKSHQPALGQSLFFMGSVVGTLTFGFLSDHIGRLPSLLLATLCGAAGDFMTSFVYTLHWFAVARFVSGLSTDTMYYLMYILVFEYLSPKSRTFGLNIILAVFYCFGLMTSPWAAIWIGNWRRYLWLASLPALGVLVYPLLICESAQWLLTKKKYDEAVACLKRVAKFNGRQVEDSAFDEFVKYYREKTIEEEKVNSQEDTFLGMFRTPRLRRFTLTLLLKSVIITLSCDVINRNMEGLGTSPFKLFSFTSIAYLPAGVAILLLQNKIGRKGMACTALLAGGIITTATGCLIAFLDPQQNAVLLAIMVALGRFGATVSYDAEIQYAAEILPTSVRGRALSNIHVAGLASSSVAFYVIYLAQYYKPLPSIFISCLMFFGAGLCLTLPETLDKKLPENLADGESFALNESFFYFPCFHRRQKPKENAVDTA